LHYINKSFVAGEGSIQNIWFTSKRFEERWFRQ